MILWKWKLQLVEYDTQIETIENPTTIVDADIKAYWSNCLDKPRGFVLQAYFWNVGLINYILFAILKQCPYL